MYDSKSMQLKVLKKINGNVEEKKWNCLYPGCEKQAINSHLLQVKGILNHVSEQNHLLEMRQNDFYAIAKGDIQYILKKIGINNAISKPLFCNFHDASLFKSIESDIVNFKAYNTGLLLSYRASCAELRRKQIVFEIEQRYLNSNLLADSISDEERDHLKVHCDGLEGGIKDLSFFKKEFEWDLGGNNIRNFIFHTFEYNPLKVCASAVWTPILPEEERRVILMQEELNTLFINVVPQADKLFIIIGYHINYVNKWMEEYINSWDLNDPVQQQKKLSDLIITKVSSWAMSPTIYQNMPLTVQNSFLNYWNENFMNLSTNQKIDINVFEINR